MLTVYSKKNPMKKLSLSSIMIVLSAFLAALLPWHGAVTVFLPEPFRYWKEAIFGLLFVVVLIKEIVQLKKKNVPEITTVEFWDMGFIGVLTFLTLLNSDLPTAALAARYLGLGFMVFLIFSSITKHFEEKEKIMKSFSSVFVISCVLSVLFGVWVKFLGGGIVVQNFYSTTISSWVPGQTIPLWHETGEFIRMQGASSGPIEFSHLLLVAFFLGLKGLLDHQTKWKRILHIVFLAILMLGIVQSYSRAAVLGLVVVILFWGAQKMGFSLPKMVRRKYFKGVLLAGLLFVISSGIYVAITPELAQNFWNRAGTSDHLTRPVEAIEKGFEKPILGHLGEWGPAARTKNLNEQLEKADIIIVAVGRPEFLHGDQIPKGATIIDVGIHRKDDGKLCGDVHFESAEKVAGKISPVPRGVGPMTVVSLIENTIEAAEATV